MTEVWVVTCESQIVPWSADTRTSVVGAFSTQEKANDFVQKQSYQSHERYDVDMLVVDSGE